MWCIICLPQVFIPLSFVVSFSIIIIILVIILLLSQPTGFYLLFTILFPIPCGTLLLARVKSQQHSLKITSEEMNTHVCTYSRVHAGTA